MALNICMVLFSAIGCFNATKPESKTACDFKPQISQKAAIAEKNQEFIRRHESNAGYWKVSS
jgi:hypothetical protein